VMYKTRFTNELEELFIELWQNIPSLCDFGCKDTVMKTRKSKQSMTLRINLEFQRRQSAAIGWDQFFGVFTAVD
jgi:hypothetical protein